MKASWKARCCLALALAVAVSQGLPVFAAGSSAEQEDAGAQSQTAAVQEAASVAVGAIWSEDFSSTTTATDSSVQAAWKDAVVPVNWNEIWLSPAPADYSKTYWEVVTDAACAGGKAIHLHSEDAAARMDIISAVSGIDYSQDYLLRMQVKTSDLSKLQVRAQVGDKGNIFLTSADIPGGTQDWFSFEMPLTDLQEVYDAKEDASKTNANGNLKLEIFSASGTTGDAWIDRMEILTQSDEEASGAEVLWSTGFDEAVTAAGNAAQYFLNGVGPRDFMSAWLPSGEVPDVDLFQLKLDDTTKSGGTYALYAKSSYPSKPDTGTTSKQRLKLAAGNFPSGVDYTRSYVLRAKVKLQNASHSNWGGAALRVDLASGSITGDRLLGTKDWQLVELSLPAEKLQEVSGKTSGKLEPSVMFEYFTGEIWVDDMELIALDTPLEMSQSSLSMMVGETRKLTTNAPAEQTLTWSSSDETVASVSADGTVTAHKSGVAVITAAAGEGNCADCTVSVRDAAVEAALQAMRGKWVERLTGNSYWAGEQTAPEYKQIVQEYEEEARDAWDQLVRDSSLQLFSDLDLDIQKKFSTAGSSTNSGDSADFSTAISRIQDMARAWAAEGSSLYHNEALKTDILYAMQWVYDHFYNETLNNQAMFGNWYHWWISMPQNLAGTVILMHDEMGEELLQKEAAALAHFNEDPLYVYKVKGAAGKMEMTGANLADTSLASLLRGAACSDQAAVINGTKYFDKIVKVVTSGEGIYADGSFIQHTDLAYTGGYGATLLTGVEKLVCLTAGSDWSIQETQLSTVFDWIWDGVRPLYANGAVFDMVSGRGVARPTSSDLKTGRGILGAVVLLSENAPALRKGALQSFAKAQLQAGAEAMGADEYYSGMNAAAMMASLTLVNDDSVEAKENTGYAKVFGGMDKAVAHSDTFSFGISYASGRTGRFEFGNEENKLGWHQGDGATYLYNGDPQQYADHYWNTVDPQRLAGITTDHSTWTLVNWGNYKGNANFNGGSSVGQYASIAMNFRNYSTSSNKDLAARKSWFIFDDEIVALGTVSGIDSSRTTETIVENKKINGGNQLVIDGKTTAPGLGDTACLENVRWAWLEGNTAADAVGYYFPETTGLNVLREARTGKWTDVNGSAGVSDEEVTRNYLSLAVPHDGSGNNSYDYVLLPGKTQEEVEAYAADPDIEILCSNSLVQAVRDNRANVTGYLFWGDQNEKIRVGDVEAVKGSVTVVKDTAEHTMTVGMADVHQLNDSLTFRVYGDGLELVSADENVTVTTDQYGAELVVNTAGAKGKTFEVTLRYCDLTDGTAAAPASTAAAAVAGQTGTEEQVVQTGGGNPKTMDEFPLTGSLLLLCASGVAIAGKFVVS